LLSNWGAGLAAPDSDGRAPLHLAAAAGHQGTAGLLIDYGAKALPLLCLSYSRTHAVSFSIEQRFDRAVSSVVSAVSSVPPHLSEAGQQKERVTGPGRERGGREGRRKGRRDGGTEGRRDGITENRHCGRIYRESPARSMLRCVHWTIRREGDRDRKRSLPTLLSLLSP
jgi:hypothetical protein